MIFKKLTKIIFVGLFEIADLCFFTDINITIFNNNAILQKKKKIVWLIRVTNCQIIFHCYLKMYLIFLVSNTNSYKFYEIE